MLLSALFLTNFAAHIIRWILSNKHVLHNPNADKLESLPFDFVCYRGLLTTMMITLYDSNNDWEIHGIKIRGTIYLCAKETDAKLVNLEIKLLVLEWANRLVIA